MQTHLPNAFPILRWVMVLLAFSALPGSLLRAEDPAQVITSGDFFTGQQMRYAFRRTVSAAHEWTVEILADGKRVALGTVVGSDGWLITKASQMTKANRVQLADGRQFPIQSTKSHLALDLALVKIDANRLTPVVWEKRDPPTGAWLITAGISAEPVMAVGVLSVPRRAIPRSSAHGYLGVELAREELPRIKRVFPNSGAFNAGLKEGDIVLMIDEHPIASAEELVRTLRDYRPGDTLSLKVRRLEEEVACPVTLMHPYGDFLSRMAFQNQMGGELSFRRDDFEAVYQHDSVIEPIDCGGPLINLDGLAVGINIARAGRTETYAIPADLVEKIVTELQTSSAVVPALTGPAAQ